MPIRRLAGGCSVNAANCEEVLLRLMTDGCATPNRPYHTESTAPSRYSAARLDQDLTTRGEA
jgi:hypothetical protein